MNSDPDLSGDAAPRKFDDIASLFGTIVPPAGTPVRSRPLAPTDEPAELRAPEPVPNPAPASWAQPAPQPAPLAEPGPVPPRGRAAPRERRPLRPSPPDAPPDPGPQAPRSRKQPAAAPWPDAFAPRPNYSRKRPSRLWYWLFLVPFAAVVAFASTLIDPRAIRTFVDTTLPSYLPSKLAGLLPHTEATNPGSSSLFMPPGFAPPGTPSAAPPSTPVAPPPDSPASGAPASPPAPPPTPSEPSVPATPPAAVQPSPRAETAPAPTDAPSSDATAAPVSLPTNAPSEAAPPITPPATAAADTVPLPPPPPPPPPAEPERPAALVPSGTRVTIQYRRGQSAGESEAKRIATKLGTGDLKPVASTSRSPVITYYNAADKDVAAALARTLAGEGSASWIVRPGPTRSASGAIDILLP